MYIRLLPEITEETKRKIRQQTVKFNDCDCHYWYGKRNQNGRPAIQTQLKRL